MPALPGLQYICEILGELFKPKHNACSLPPPPMTRTLLSPISSGRGIQFIIYFAQFISLFRQMLSAFMARATYANSQRCCIGFGNSFTKHHDSMAIFAGIFGQYICHDVGANGYQKQDMDHGQLMVAKIGKMVTEFWVMVKTSEWINWWFNYIWHIMCNYSCVHG